MDLEKIKNLGENSSLIINGRKFKVIDIDRGIQPSEEVKEFTLKDEENNEYLLQIVLNKTITLWKIEIDPLTGKSKFLEKNLIKIDTIRAYHLMNL